MIEQDRSFFLKIVCHVLFQNKYFMIYRSSKIYDTPMIMI